MIAPRSTPEQWPEMLTAMHASIDAMRSLSLDAQTELICSLLTQQICKLPPGQRPAELRRVIEDLPSILHLTETGLREALLQNARKGL